MWGSVAQAATVTPPFFAAGRWLRGRQRHLGNAVLRLGTGGSPPDPSPHGFPSFQPLDAAGRGGAGTAAAKPRLALQLLPSVPAAPRGERAEILVALSTLFPSAGFPKHSHFWVGCRLDPLPAAFWILNKGAPLPIPASSPFAPSKGSHVPAGDPTQSPPGRGAQAGLLFLN